MKTSLKNILMMMIAVSSIGAIAKAAPDCEKVDLNGIYRFETVHSHVLNITQHGCEVKVYDTTEHARWTFDLSGLVPTKVPDAILKKNKDSELGRKSLPTAVLNFSAPDFAVNSNYQEIYFLTQMNLPKAEYNKFDVDVAIKGRFLITSNKIDKNGQNFGPLLSSDGRSIITNINLYDMKIKVTQVHDAVFTGILAKAFVAGANYVLGMVDLGSLSGMHVSLERIK